MENNNTNYKIFKFLGIAVVLFYAFIFIGSSFVTVGIKDPEPLYTESSWDSYSHLEAKLEDAEILGKFWNSKGHFIVVYNDTKKAPEVFEVDFSEWQYMRIGEKY